MHFHDRLHNPQILIDEESNEITIVSEEEKQGFLNAADVIEKYCEKQKLESDEEKLRYVASRLPDCFSKNTRYEKYYNMLIAK